MKNNPSPQAQKTIRKYLYPFLNIMPYEQIITQILLALAVGTFTSVMSKLKTGVAWDSQKFAYTIGLSFVSGLVAVNAIEGGVDQTNIIKVFLEMLGANFIGHTFLAVGNRLRVGKAKTTKSSP